MRFPFTAAPASDIFSDKGNLFSGIPNVFSIADDILIEGFDKQGKDHDETVDKLLRVCIQANLKLNKDNSLFRGIIFSGYIKLPKFSPVTAEVCKLLEKLTSVKADWTWNGITRTCTTERRI